MNLVALFEEALEFQNFNGTVLSNGKVKVYYIGRTSLADIYNDVAGEYPSENPKVLDNLGMGPIYVNPAFDYEIVVYDEYDNELFSVKKYLHSNGAHSTSNVEVVPSENIQVSAWTQGDVQVYMPYITGNLGKVYSGVEPIVVNNDEDKISANHVPLGLQEPLFFVQDDENACIIGCSAQTEIPSSVSSKWEDASDTVINNSAKWNIGTVYTAGNYIDIDNDVISVTGLQPAGDYAYNSAVSSKLDTTAFSAVSGDFLTAVDLTPYQEKSAMSGYLTTGDSAQFYTNDNPSGFITGVDLSDYATTGDLANKLDTTAFSNVSGDFITALPEDLVYTGDLSDYATKDFVNDNIDSATSGLLPTSSFSSVSGSFLTALPSDLVYTADITGKQDISGMTAYQPKSAMNIYLTNYAASITYQPTAGMTAYQSAGDYYSASNPSGFITGVDLTPYQTTAGMTAYQPAGDYLTTADSAQFITALPADLVYTADITGFATTADLTSKLDKSDSANFLLTSDSGNFYTTANESGFITGIPDELTLTALNVIGQIDPEQSEMEGVTITQTGISIGNDLVGNVDVDINAVENWNSTYNTVSTNSASWTATTIPSEVTAAASAVSSNSANWNSTYNTVNANSADWSVSEEIFGTNGIKISESADKVIIEVSADYYSASNPSGFITGVDLTPYQTTAGMTAYQAAGDYLSTGDSANFYPTSNPSGFINGIPEQLNLSELYIEGEIDPEQSEKEGVFITQTGISIYNELVGSVDIDINSVEKWDDTNNVLTANSAAWNEVSAKQPSGNYYSASNPSGFITGINYNTGSI